MIVSSLKDVGEAKEGFKNFLKIGLVLNAVTVSGMHVARLEIHNKHKM